MTPKLAEIRDVQEIPKFTINEKLPLKLPVGEKGVRF
jgi:hypothetical protein